MSPLGKFLLENCVYINGHLRIHHMLIQDFFEKNWKILNYIETISYPEKIGLRICFKRIHEYE